MRIVVQRVSSASVAIEGAVQSAINQGLLILLGIEHTDTETDAEWLAQKIAALRVFNDAEGKMNLSINSICGDIIVVSQFTLHASTKKGNRPSFISAARPEQAIPLYEFFIRTLASLIEGKVLTGTFGADMQVNLCNDGPVTIYMDSKHKE